jgi:hypothetical protein
MLIALRKIINEIKQAERDFVNKMSSLVLKLDKEVKRIEEERKK